jgi:hypothetical protein
MGIHSGYHGRYLGQPVEPKGRLFSCSACGHTVTTKWTGLYGYTDEICGHCGVDVASEPGRRLADRKALQRIDKLVQGLESKLTSEDPVRRAKVRRARTRALNR